jgi:tyrosyl-tRNA synthetase
MKVGAEDLAGGGITPVALLRRAGFVSSNSEARRKIAEGAVALNGDLVTQPDARLNVKSGDILRLGKRRFKRIVFPAPGKT